MAQMKKFYRKVFIPAALAISLAACGSNDSSNGYTNGPTPTPTPSPTPTPTPPPGQEPTLEYLTLTYVSSDPELFPDRGVLVVDYKVSGCNQCTLELKVADAPITNNSAFNRAAPLTHVPPVENGEQTAEHWDILSNTGYVVTSRLNGRFKSSNNVQVGTLPWERGPVGYQVHSGIEETEQFIRENLEMIASAMASTNQVGLVNDQGGTLGHWAYQAIVNALRAYSDFIRDNGRARGMNYWIQQPNQCGFSFTLVIDGKDFVAYSMDCGIAEPVVKKATQTFGVEQGWYPYGESARYPSQMAERDTYSQIMAPQRDMRDTRKRISTGSPNLRGGKR